MAAVKSVCLRLWRCLPPRVKYAFPVECMRFLLPKAQGCAVPCDAPLYVVGFFQTASGLGESARLYYDQALTLRKKIYPVDISHLLSVPPGKDLEYSTLLKGKDFPLHAGPGEVAVHANPPHFMLALWHVRKLLPGKRITAYWVWELEDIPEFWARCLEYTDEVGCPSSFVVNAVRKRTEKPVKLHPYQVRPLAAAARHKDTSNFRVFTSFDMASNFYRKNPLASVAAFQKAFSQEPDAELVIKIGTPEKYPQGWELLQRAARGHANIIFLTERLNSREMGEQYNRSHVYISLHRSEGYGLNIREAMLQGVDVIATGWSGNMDFMRGEGSMPVPYTLVPLEDPQQNYPMAKNSRWAEPDIDAAAHLLREAFTKVLGRPPR